MKTVNIVVSGKRGSLWRFWIGALAGAGYRINVLDHEALKSKSIEIFPQDTILLDGTLPNLALCISDTCALYPNTQIIVASEANSFSIQYEVLQFEGAIYISGPIPPDQFVDAFQRTAPRAAISA